jgi:hypothetical protein
MGSHLMAVVNFNLNMMMKIEFFKNEIADGLIKYIKGLYIHVRTSYNSPIKKKKL